jgi:hypothetical protein
MAVVVGEGNHRVTLQYRIRGFWPGLALALGSLVTLLVDVARRRRPVEDLTHVDAAC